MSADDSRDGRLPRLRDDENVIIGTHVKTNSDRVRSCRVLLFGGKIVSCLLTAVFFIHFESYTKQTRATARALQTHGVYAYV